MKQIVIPRNRSQKYKSNMKDKELKYEEQKREIYEKKDNKRLKR